MPTFPSGSTADTASWFVRAHGDGFLDASVVGLSDRAFRVFLVLDCRAGMRPYCYPSNEWVCRKAGKRNSALCEIFADLEEAGWIRRIYTDATRKERLGFALLRRVDPEAPAAVGTPAGVDRARRAMLDAMAGDDSGFPESRPDVTPDFRSQEPPCLRISGDNDSGFPDAYKENTRLCRKTAIAS